MVASLDWKYLARTKKANLRRTAWSPELEASATKAVTYIIHKSCVLRRSPYIIHVAKTVIPLPKVHHILLKGVSIALEQLDARAFVLLQQNEEELEDPVKQNGISRSDIPRQQEKPCRRLTCFSLPHCNISLHSLATSSSLPSSAANVELKTRQRPVETLFAARTVRPLGVGARGAALSKKSLLPK